MSIAANAILVGTSRKWAIGLFSDFGTQGNPLDMIFEP
jgi:hypothetical protein